MEKILRSATVRAFEDFGFLLPVSGQATPNDRDEADAAAVVEFDGPLAGKLVLRVYGGLAAVMAANMLGTDGAPPRLTQLDAVCEMANVVCGNVLPMLSGSPRAFRIDAPAAVSEGDLEWLEHIRPSADVLVGFEEGSVRVRLYLDS